MKADCLYQDSMVISQALKVRNLLLCVGLLLLGSSLGRTWPNSLCETVNVKVLMLGIPGPSEPYYWYFNEFGWEVDLWCLSGCLGEIKVVEEIVGFLRARRDLDEPDADSTRFVGSPDVFFSPAETSDRSSNRIGDLAFFTIQPIVLGVEGREGGEGGGTPQFTVDVQRVVAA